MIQKSFSSRNKKIYTPRQNRPFSFTVTWYLTAHLLRKTQTNKKEPETKTEKPKQKYEMRTNKNENRLKEMSMQNTFSDGKKSLSKKGKK